MFSGTRTESWFCRGCLILVILFVSMQPVFGQSLEEAEGLTDQVLQLYGQGKYAEAILFAKRAMEIRVRLLGEKHPDTAESYNNLGELYRVIGDYGKAEPLYQTALEISKEVLGEKHADTATNYSNLGSLYQDMGDYGKAEPLYEKALAIRKEVLGEKHPDTARSFNNLGNLYQDMGDYGKAEPLLEKALAIHKEVFGEKHPNTATSYNNLGELYRAMGDYGKAEPLYQKALAIRKEVLGEEHPRSATSYNNLGALYQNMGDYGKAEPLYQKALAIDKEVLGEKHPDTATNYSNLGELYRGIGDYSKAEPLYQKALAIRKEILGEKHPDTATNYNNLGSLYQDMGDYGQAEPLYEMALAIRKEVLGEKHPDTATSYNNLGALYQAMGDYGKSEPLYQKALAIRKEVLGEKHPRTATSYNNLGFLYQDMGDYGKAEPLYEKALAIDKEVLGEKHPNTASSYTNLGFLYLAHGEIGRAFDMFKRQNSPAGLGCCYLAEGRFDKAMSEFERSLESSEKTGEKEFIIGDNLGLGLSHEGLGNYAGAKSRFSLAIEIMESQRGALSGASRESFLSGKVGAGFSRLDAYEGMVRVLLKEKRPGYEKEALNCFERAKARLFLEMLATRSLRGRSETDEKTLLKDKEFQVKLTSLQKLIPILALLRDKAPKGRKEETQKELDAVSKEYETFIKDVRLKNSELASLITVDPPSVERLQEALDPDVTLLEYFTAKEATYAWLMTRESVRMFEIAAGEKKVDQLVNHLLLQRKQDGEHFFYEAAKDIHDTLFSPLRKEIKTTRLIVVPHGSLHKLPFSALNYGTRCLVDDYDLSVLPSASVIPQVVQKRKADNGEFLAFGNPKRDSDPLVSAEEEVENVGKMFSVSKVYIREKATKVLLKEEAGGPGVIHLACHGEFNDRQPLHSGLLLAKEGDDDGRLRVHEVFGLNLKSANLVTLSACQTALGKVSSGDDMVGLSRAFLYAGTPSLLATLWSVEDTSTALLMEHFYDNWRNKTMSKPEALRQAQLSLKDMPEYRHPFFWAAFVLIGDWR
jgi:tetratricopeptide (TPR) repeat protein/CHAT domain-containing protein